MDDGGALSLKTQFVHFIKNGKHGRQIEDNKEVGERLLQDQDRTHRCVAKLHGSGMKVGARDRTDRKAARTKSL